MKPITSLTIALTFSILACAKAQVVSEVAPAPPRVEQAVPPPSTNVTSETKAPAVAVAPAAVAAAPVPTPLEPSEVVWNLRKGKLQGPGQVGAKTIGTTKDPKSGAVTTTRCWKYS